MELAVYYVRNDYLKDSYDLLDGYIKVKPYKDNGALLAYHAMVGYELSRRTVLLCIKFEKEEESYLFYSPLFSLLLLLPPSSPLSSPPSHAIPADSFLFSGGEMDEGEALHLVTECLHHSLSDKSHETPFHLLELRLSVPILLLPLHVIPRPFSPGYPLPPALPSSSLPNSPSIFSLPLMYLL